MSKVDQLKSTILKVFLDNQSDYDLLTSDLIEDVLNEVVTSDDFDFLAKELSLEEKVRELVTKYSDENADALDDKI